MQNLLIEVIRSLVLEACRKGPVDADNIARRLCKRDPSLDRLEINNAVIRLLREAVASGDCDETDKGKRPRSLN